MERAFRPLGINAFAIDEAEVCLYATGAGKWTEVRG